MIFFMNPVPLPRRHGSTLAESLDATGTPNDNDLVSISVSLQSKCIVCTC